MLKLDRNDNKVSPKEKAVRFMLMLSIDQEMSWGFIGGTSEGDSYQWSRNNPLL